MGASSRNRRTGLRNRMGSTRFIQGIFSENRELREQK